MLADIRKALTDHTAGLATEILGQYLQREAETKKPVTGDPYTTMKILHQRQALGLGPNPGHLWTGTLQLDLVHPVNLGAPAAARRTDAMLAAWPRALTLLSGQAVVIIELANPAATFTAADWIHSPVTINWMSEEPPA